MEELTLKAIATMLVSLRIAPALAFSPPFTLLRIPPVVRLLLALALAARMVNDYPRQTWQLERWRFNLVIVAMAELLLGLVLVLALQIAFAALLVAGRAIDMQAGFGLATLIDPTSRAPIPLTGTLFVYATAAIFFLTQGPADLLGVWAASIEKAPLGAVSLSATVGPVIGYVSAVFLLAFGAGGLAMLVLFLIDLAIAFMSRTLPQMNVLMLGFQVKTLAMLLVLPMAIALSTSVFVRMLRYALQTAAGLG